MLSCTLSQDDLGSQSHRNMKAVQFNLLEGISLCASLQSPKVIIEGDSFLLMGSLQTRGTLSLPLKYTWKSSYLRLIV